MTTIAAERVGIIRPLDGATGDALRRLCETTGARIRRGALMLNGREYTALLATRDGVTLAALLDAEPTEQDAQQEGLTTP